MKKTLGYGYRLVGESIGYSLDIYLGGGFNSLHKTRLEAEADFKIAQKRGDVSKRTKCRVFKLIMETK